MAVSTSFSSRPTRVSSCVHPQQVSQLASMRCPPSVRIDSGWNWTPWIGSPVCCTAMITPLLVRAVTLSTAGSDLGRIVNEWYRVAVKGSGSPCSTPTLVWNTLLVLPCNSSGARSTVAPNATPMAWCPRQTPSKGVCAAAHACTILTDAPARSGVPGPGLSRTPSNWPATAASSDSRWSSLRHTSASMPSWPRYCTRLNTKLS